MTSGIPPDVRTLVGKRDGGRCRACAARTRQIHHRLPRRMGGTTDPRSTDPRNLVTLCGSGTTGCHGWVESNRDAARESGWLLGSYDELDRPLETRWGRVWLHADGTAHDEPALVTHEWPGGTIIPPGGTERT